MIFDTGVWLVISYLCGLTTGYCLYGDDPECAFQCHCAVDSECSGGTCPSGCDTAPLGHNWRGPACQIGNVGLHKPANMTADYAYQRLFPPTAALDGVSPGFLNANCAHPTAPGNNSAQWWTDLGDVYKIYNITIYGNNVTMLEQFELTVYNTSDNKVLCGYHHGPVFTHSTITCTQPVIGRYVHCKKVGGPAIFWTSICEVVIIGHKYIDCTGCPTGVSCSDVTGCTQCSGSYPPDCKTKCESGYYGTNCQQHCGHCKDGVTCDNQNGRCYTGCQMWWADDRCDKYIEKPNGTEKWISLIQKTESSIGIKWQHLSGISDALKQYYGYLLRYKDETTGASYREAGTVSYSSSPYWKFENLKSYTSYSIQIKPFRMFDNQKDYGSPYPVLQVKTSCGEPETPQIKTDTLIFEEEGLPEILVLWKDISNLEAHCAYISNIYLEYKLKNGNEFKSVYVDLHATNYTINTTAAGEYNIRLVVVNNEGLSSASNFSCITVIDSSAFESSAKGSTAISLLYITTIVMVILLIIIITLAFVLWKARRQPLIQNSSGTTPRSAESELPPQIVEYELDTPSASNNQHNLDVEPRPKNRNDDVAQNEDIKEPDTMVKSQNTNEGLTDEARAVYENKMMTGPYGELQK